MSKHQSTVRSPVKVKHDWVTDADRGKIAETVAGHRKDMNDFAVGIELAKELLKHEVKDLGLYSFASMVLSGNQSNPPYTSVEHEIACSLFSELNQKPAVGISLELHSHE